MKVKNKGLKCYDTKYYIITVEPPITDPLTRGQPLYEDTSYMARIEITI